MEEGIRVPEENKKFIELYGTNGYQDSSISKKVYATFSHGKYKYNAVLKDCKINGRPVVGFDNSGAYNYLIICDADLSDHPLGPPSFVLDDNNDMYWHKIKDLKMNKYNLVFCHETKFYAANGNQNYSGHRGTGNFALESLILDEVQQNAELFTHNNKRYYTDISPWYSRLAIGTYDTDKFKFSITGPTDSLEHFYINYAPDISNNTLPLNLFEGQVGIGPTLNCDWIYDKSEACSLTYTFDGCENLEEISMKNYRPTFVGDWSAKYVSTFRNCHKLKWIDCGLSLFGAWRPEGTLFGTFENCYSLKYINFQIVEATNFPDDPELISNNVFKNCNSLQAIFIGNWDELSLNDRATITDKFKNLLRLSGINPDTIYIGKYDLTVIH